MTWTCDASTTRNSTVPAVTLAPVAASRWAMTPLTGARIDEQVLSASAAPPMRAALYCARLRLGGGQTRRGLLLRRSRLVEPLLRARRRPSSDVRRAHDRASRGRARTAPPRAPAAVAEDRRERLAAAAVAPVPVRESQSTPVARRAHCIRRPSIGATTSAAPPGLASTRAGTRIDSRTALLVHHRRAEIEAPLLFLEKADPRQSLRRHRGPRTRRGGSRVHRHLADAVFVVQPCCTQHDDELALPACAGFTSTPKMPGRDGASTRNTSAGSAAASSDGPRRVPRSAP